MIKLAISLITFLKELFSEKKDDLDISSVNFNLKKAFIFTAFSVLLLLNFGTVNRFIALTKKYTRLEERYIGLIYHTMSKEDFKKEMAALDKLNLISHIYKCPTAYDDSANAPKGPPVEHKP